MRGGNFVTTSGCKVEWNIFYTCLRISSVQSVRYKHYTLILSCPQSVEPELIREPLGGHSLKVTWKCHVTRKWWSGFEDVDLGTWGWTWGDRENERERETPEGIVAAAATIATPAFNFDKPLHTPPPSLIHRSLSLQFRLEVCASKSLLSHFPASYPPQSAFRGSLYSQLSLSLSLHQGIASYSSSLKGIIYWLRSVCLCGGLGHIITVSAWFNR